MAYSKFTLVEIVERFSLIIKRGAVLEAVKPIPISDFLKESLTRGIGIALPNGSEKARSELLVSPFLVELKQINAGTISVFSGEVLDADKKKGLNGECDFILSFNDNQLFIDAPIFTIVEAKKNDIGESFGQCVAQMLGAKIFNETHRKNIHTIFGCVTTGDRWHFLKLHDTTVSIAPKDIILDTNEDLILGTLQHIVESSKPQ
ncbi:MAG: hypothetical protein MUE30_13220 [Spirosomaceae bacterium]|jgi:hypothetical protein|nr:hypothetical protein [Spirosomataceae bacterium]